jgi:hypothetical protein
MKTCSELLKDYLKDVKPEDPGFQLLWQIEGFLEAGESGKADEKAEQENLEQETAQLMKRCLDNAESIMIGTFPGASVSVGRVVKIAITMMDYIKSKGTLSEMMDKIAQGIPSFPSRKTDVPFPTLLTKAYGSMADDPIERGEQGQFEKREDMNALQSDLESPFGPPTAGGEIDVRKLRDSLPFNAYSMKVLCVDEMNKLQIVKTVKEVKYIPVVLLGTTPDYYEIVERDSPEYTSAMIGLLIES